MLFETQQQYARVAELADAHVWGACGFHRTGSSPVSRTKKNSFVYLTKEFFSIIFVLWGTGDISLTWYRSSSDDIRFAYEVTDIISNKVKIFYVLLLTKGVFCGIFIPLTVVEGCPSGLRSWSWKPVTRSLEPWVRISLPPPLFTTKPNKRSSPWRSTQAGEEAPLLRV